ncbi:MAG: hypothetical protein ACKO4Y_00540 [Flavobacteriales bacterium]
MNPLHMVNWYYTSPDEGTHIIWEFEPENQNPVELQQQGWQSILNNFKTYLE